MSNSSDDAVRTITNRDLWKEMVLLRKDLNKCDGKVDTLVSLITILVKSGEGKVKDASNQTDDDSFVVVLNDVNKASALKLLSNMMLGDEEGGLGGSRKSEEARVDKVTELDMMISGGTSAGLQHRHDVLVNEVVFDHRVFDMTFHGPLGTIKLSQRWILQHVAVLAVVLDVTLFNASKDLTHERARDHGDKILGGEVRFMLDEFHERIQRKWICYADDVPTSKATADAETALVQDSSAKDKGKAVVQKPRKIRKATDNVRKPMNALQKKLFKSVVDYSLMTHKFGYKDMDSNEQPARPSTSNMVETLCAIGNVVKKRPTSGSGPTVRASEEGEPLQPTVGTDGAELAKENDNAEGLEERDLVSFFSHWEGCIVDRPDLANETIGHTIEPCSSNTVTTGSAHSESKDISTESAKLQKAVRDVEVAEHPQASFSTNENEGSKNGGVEKLKTRDLVPFEVDWAGSMVERPDLANVVIERKNGGVLIGTNEESSAPSKLKMDLDKLKKPAVSKPEPTMARKPGKIRRATDGWAKPMDRRQKKVFQSLVDYKMMTIKFGYDDEVQKQQPLLPTSTVVFKYVAVEGGNSSSHTANSSPSLCGSSTPRGGSSRGIGTYGVSISLNNLFGNQAPEIQSPGVDASAETLTNSLDRIDQAPINTSHPATLKLPTTSSSESKTSQVDVPPGEWGPRMSIEAFFEMVKAESQPSSPQNARLIPLVGQKISFEELMSTKTDSPKGVNLSTSQQRLNESQPASPPSATIPTVGERISFEELMATQQAASPGPGKTFESTPSSSPLSSCSNPTSPPQTSTLNAVRMSVDEFFARAKFIETAATTTAPKATTSRHVNMFTPKSSRSSSGSASSAATTSSLSSSAFMTTTTPVTAGSPPPVDRVPLVGRRISFEGLLLNGGPSVHHNV
ncbi:hypothetical protein HDU76_004462, partial [Blyttiomyces sp. JEL0837]